MDEATGRVRLLVILSRVGKAAAFFDLDKTIIAKSSTLAFGKSFYQGGLINRRAVLRSAYLSHATSTQPQAMAVNLSAKTSYARRVPPCAVT